MTNDSFPQAYTGQPQKAPGEPSQAPIKLDLAFEKFTLDNGLTVLVHEDRKAPVVAVNIWYRVGAKDEPAGKTGFAHLFEHLMCGGSDHLPGSILPHKTRIGATELNATTSYDRTNYFATVPTNALDFAMFGNHGADAASAAGGDLPCAHPQRPRYATMACGRSRHSREHARGNPRRSLRGDTARQTDRRYRRRASARDPTTRARMSNSRLSLCYAPKS